MYASCVCLIFCALLIFCARKFPEKSETQEPRGIIVECTSYKWKNIYMMVVYMMVVMYNKGCDLIEMQGDINSVVYL